MRARFTIPIRIQFIGIFLLTLTQGFIPHQSIMKKKQTSIMSTTSNLKMTSTSKVFPNNAFPPILPKLIVFDLDNTLWTPELYQLNRKLRQKKISCPRANQDIHLFPDVITILTDIVTHSDLYQFHPTTQNHSSSSILLAIASRTNHYTWANALLHQFTIPNTKTNIDLPLIDFFPQEPLVQIVKGSKLHHFEQLQKHTGIAYRDMLFFDDDKHMNCNEISQKLGLLSSHCPNGLTLDIFRESLLEYACKKEGKPKNIYMGYILTEMNLGIKSEDDLGMGEGGGVQNGIVKFYSPAKKYGFIKNVNTGDDLFVHESKIPGGMILSKGQSVLFEQIIDGKGRASAIVISAANNETSSKSMKKSVPKSSKPQKISSYSKEEMMDMPCFSMSQPFASLLLYNIKDIESRKNQMFERIKPGTKILLHCGKRDWKDQKAPIVELEKAGYTSTEIQKYTTLPKGFQRGHILGVVTVGKTWKTAERERRGENMQKRVVAKTENIGEYCTIIEDAKWFSKPVTNVRGQPGVYNAVIPKSYLKD